MKLTWQEIVDKYPDKWVALSDVEFDNTEVKSGVVKASCTDSEVASLFMEFKSKGINYYWIRATDFTNKDTEEFDINDPRWNAINKFGFMGFGILAALSAQEDKGSSLE